MNYRIKRLEEEGIITQYQVIVNLSALNVLQFKICLAFQHLKPSRFKEIVAKLKRKEEVKWIVSCRGRWDLLISSEAKSLEEIDVLKDEILSLFEGYVHKKAISILIEAENYHRDYLLDDKKASPRTRIVMDKTKEIKLDDLDIKILKKLAEDGRKPVIEIASALKQSERIVGYRLKQLEKKKIILGYKIAINYEKLGIKFFKAFIYLDNPGKEKIHALIRDLGRNKQIIHHVKVLGNWDLEPEFEVYSEGEFNKLLDEIKSSFSDIIKNIEVIMIIEEHKFVYL